MAVAAEPNHFTDLKIIHITDTHLLDQESACLHGYNTRASFENVLQASCIAMPDADFILLTGDISQTGSERSYRQLPSILGNIDIPVFAVPGNHDSPLYLQQHFSQCPHAEIVLVEQFSCPLVLISSWIPGVHHGEVPAHCLEQLENYLASCTAELVCIGMHHPPVSTGSKWLDRLGLKNGYELIEIIRNKSINTIILCGHIHQELEVKSGPVTLFATPSSCHQFTPQSEHMLIDHSRSPAFRTITIRASQIVESAIHYLG